MNKKALNVIFSTLLLIAVIVIAARYVAAERYFYFWDSGLYQRMMIPQVEVSLVSALRPISLAIRSLGDDYNLLFTLPLIPLMRFIGHYDSRSTYVVSLALAYQLPYLLVVAAIAKQILPRRRFSPFWPMAFLVLVTPVAWIPTWRGYPDAGGACLISLGVWAYVYDPTLKKWWQIPLIGVALAAAPLFRRHFAYGATAFLATIVLMTLAIFLNEIRRHQSEARRRLFLRSMQIGLVVLVSAGVLLTFGLRFVRHVLSQKAQSLSSWEISPMQVSLYFQEYYGWLTLLLAGIGLAVGISRYAEKRQQITFVALFGAISAAQWMLVVRQPNPHYTLHFTAAVIIGLGILAWVIWDKLQGKWHALGLTAIGSYFALNAAFGVAPHLFPSNSGLFSLFAGRGEPLQRSDYSEIAGIVHELHRLATRFEPISVFASSGVLNYDLLVVADRTLYPNQPLNLIFTPEIDSRDSYAIEALLRAKYIVNARPLQIHLASSEHEVLSSVYRELTENGEISQDFNLLPMVFSLMNDVQVELYQRVKDTDLNVAIRTLARIQESVSQKPINQPDWIQLTNFHRGAISSANGVYQLQTCLTAPEATTAFLYLGNLPPADKVSVSGMVQSAACGNVRLEWSAAYPNGMHVPLTIFTLASEKIETFSAEFHLLEAPCLLLMVSCGAPCENPCQVTIKPKITF